MTVSILGVRHHGPGSARSVLAALDRLGPDAVLIEGPADASALIPLAADPAMRPPVALLVYAPDEPRVATFYPLAAFSPEWIAMRWALEHGVDVRFVDLPAGVQFALGKEAFEKAESGAPRPEGPESAGESAPPEAVIEAVRSDPLTELAKAAGEDDGERLWDRLVESRRDPGDLFEAVSEAMAAVRGAVGEAETLTLQREAAMRRGIREATRAGRSRVAVVCGAWHAPALATMPSAAEDDRLLRGLPRAAKTAAAWVPWTYERLAAESGYGAGIVSPGWYEHLWSGREPIAVSWMAKVAAVFRAEGLDASAAHLIEAARLADTLAAMRGRSSPTLAELNEAVIACLAMGSPLPLAVVRRKLVVGEVMGETPPDAPVAPLAADLDRQTRRLRLARGPGQKSLDLDLRNETDLARSHLLHRLNLLGIPWGRPERVAGKSGTFHELWSLAWQPEYVVSLVAASRYGNTVAEAASAKAMDVAREAERLPELTALIEVVLLADLADAAGTVVERIATVAAVGADVPALMAALPPLARVLRYGNVRGTNVDAVAGVVEGLVARICVGLAIAVASLDDDAAAEMSRLIDGVHAAIAMLDVAEDRESWRAALARVADQSGVNGLVAGRICRLLLDEGAFDSREATRRMRLWLSPGAPALDGAAWVEGFLRASGTILLHDDALFAALDGWVTELTGEVFETVLPLLRRTVATFEVPERRSIGERVARGRGRGRDRHDDHDDLDPARADLVMPILARILGLPGVSA